MEIPANIQKYIQPKLYAWGLLMICLGTLNVSKAIASISTVGVAVMAAGYVIVFGSWGRLSRSPVAWALGGMFLLSVVAGLWTEDLAGWGADIRRKFPLILLGFSMAILPVFSGRMKSGLIAIFILSQAVLAFISLIEVGMNYEMIVDSVGKNSNIEVAGSLSHIYFGLFLATSVFLAFDLFLKKIFLWREFEQWVFLGLGLFNFLALHAFTSRTGLVAFYLAALAGILVYVQRKRAWFLGILLILLLGGIPVAAYFGVPAFQQRVHVTIWDLQQMNNEERDLSDLSASMRLATWQTTWEIFRQHPLLGVGMADLDEEMAAQFERNSLGARASKPMLNPHNQYLSFLGAFGLLGGGILILYFSGMLKRYTSPRSLIVITFTVLIATGMLFESLLERQAGMTFFAIFSIFLLSPEEESPKEIHEIEQE